MQSQWGNFPKQGGVFQNRGASNQPASSQGGSIFNKKSEGIFPSQNKMMTSNPGSQNKSSGFFPKQSPFTKPAGPSSSPFASTKPQGGLFKPSSQNPQKVFPSSSKPSSPFTGGTPATGIFPSGQKSSGGIFNKSGGDSSKNPFNSGPSQGMSPFTSSKSSIFPKKEDTAPASGQGWSGIQGQGGNNQNNLFKSKGAPFGKPNDSKPNDAKPASPFQSSESTWGRKASPFQKSQEPQNNNTAPKRSLWGEKSKSEFVPHVTKPSSANSPKIEEVSGGENAQKDPSSIFGKSSKPGGLFQKQKSPFGGQKPTEVKESNKVPGGPFAKSGTSSSVFTQKGQSKFQPSSGGSNPFSKSQTEEVKKQESKTIFNLPKDGTAANSKPSSLFKSSTQTQPPAQSKPASSSLFNPKENPQEQKKSTWGPTPPSGQQKAPASGTGKAAAPGVAGTPFSKASAPSAFNPAKSSTGEGAMSGPSMNVKEAPARKKEEYQPPQAVMSQRKEAEVKKEDTSDFFKKLRLKEYVRLMREMLFMKGQQQFTEVVQMVDRSERKVERLLEQEEVITEQINQWTSKRKEFEESLFHQEQLLDSVLLRTREMISELQTLDAFSGMEHIFQKILQLIDLEADDDEIDPTQILYSKNGNIWKDPDQPISGIVNEDEFNALLRDLIVGNAEEKCLSSIKILMMYEQTERIREELNSLSTTLGSGLHRKLHEWGQAKNKGYMEEQIRCLQLFNKFFSQLDSLNSSIESSQEKLREAIRIKQKLETQGESISRLFR